jgi:hypothetical protein
MTKIIIPFFAFACMLSGVSAQTTKDGDLRECTGKGSNTCKRWKHCNWRGTESDGECYNDCPLINTGGSELGTTRDCQNLEGCDVVAKSQRCDFKSKVVDCSSANNPDWFTTWQQCQAILGCMFNPIFGKNECIEIAAWSPEAYVNVQNDRDGDEDEDTQSESSGDVSSEDNVNEMPSGDSNSTYTSADSSDSDSDSGGSSNSNDLSNAASSSDRDGGRKSYLRQSRL